MLKMFHKTLVLILLISTSVFSQELFIMKNNIGGCDNFSFANGSGPERVYYIKSNNGDIICPIKNFQGLNGEYILVFDSLPNLYFNDYSAEDWSCGGPCYACGYLLVGNELCNLKFANLASEDLCNLSIDVPYYFMTSNKVLTNPTILDNSFCESIPLKAGTCSTTQKFSWYYSTDGINYTSMNKTTLYNESFTFNKTDFLPNSYTGNIYFKVLIDTDSTVVGEEVYSNIITYTVISCSPKLVSSTVVSNAKCFNSSDGSILFKFDRDLDLNEKFIFTLKNSVNNGVVDQREVLASEFNSHNQEYLWSSLHESSYVLEYQTIKGTDAPSSLVSSPSILITSPSKVTFSTSKTNVLCHGAATGAITVEASGGTGNYQYSKDGGASWQSSNVFTGLVAGNYPVVVKDVNSGTDCIAPDGNQQITITQPASPLAIQLVSAVNPSSNVSTDGSIDVTVTGGTGNYTYLWTSSTNNISGQSAQEDLSGLAGDATYTLTVKDENNCTAVFNQTLDAPDPIVITFNNAEIRCFGGATSLTGTITGGNIPYASFQWVPNSFSPVNTANSSTLNNVPAGNYTLIVTDAKGVVRSSAYTINPAPAQISITGENTTVIGGVNSVIQKCFGNNSDILIDVSVTGGVSPYTYNWYATSNPTVSIHSTEDLSNVSPGSYRLEVKDANNCIFSKNFNVLAASQLTFTTSKVNIVDPGTNTGSIIVNPNGGTGSYEFSTNGTNWQSDATFSNLAAGNYTVYVKDSNNCIVGPQSVTITEPPAFTISITALTSINCFGANNGSLKVTATGGTPYSTGSPYTFSWSDDKGNSYTGDTITNLTAGSYTVVVADSNGVTRTITNYTLNQPNKLTGSAIKADVSCNGGNDGIITFSASGGTAPYSYYVNGVVYTSNVISNLASGNYTCEIRDSKNCSVSLPGVVINAPLPITVNATIYPVTNASTTDGFITLNVSGGTPPYTYVWSPNVGNTNNPVNLGTGTYGVTITDSKGCTFSDSYTISTIQPLTVSLNTQNSVTQLSCYGNTNGKLAVDVIGGRPGATTPNYKYEWKNGSNQIIGSSASLINLAVGSYTVTVTDFNTPPTSVQQTFTITQPNPLSIAMQIVTPILCFGDKGNLTVTVTGGTPSYSYEWRNSANQIVGTNQTLTGVDAGTYTCKVTDANLCFTTQVISITSPTVVTATATLTNVQINGQSTGSITINASGGTAPYTYLLNGNPQPTNQFTNLPAGTYTVLVQDANNCIWTTTVVISQPAPLAIALTQSGQIACFGGNSVTLNTVVTGGIAPYYYQWKKDGSIIPNAITASLLNVGAGNYEVIVTDNVGAIHTTTITVSQPQELKATYTTTQVSCAATNSGSVTLQVTGGTAPYSYSWNTGTSTINTLSNVPIGTYSVVIIDAKGCSLTVSNISITSNTGLNIGATVNDVSCGNLDNGSITLNPTGGTGNYSIVWDNANYSGFVLTNLAPGNYSGKLIDGVCNLPFSFNIQGTTPLTIDLGADVVLCEGQSHAIDATVTGQTVTYEWTSTNGFTSDKPIVSVTESGIYTLTITTISGCKYSDAVEITKLGESIESKSMVASQLIKNQEIIMVNISERNNNTYQWIVPSQAQIISQTDDALVVKFAEIGKYNIGLKASNQSGCESLEYKEILVEEGDGSSVDTGTIFIKQFTIFPNPIEAISNEFNVLAELAYEMPVTLSIYRLEQGVLINEVHLPAAKIHSKQFNLNLSSGVYLVVLKTPGSIQAKKIIKN